MTRTMTTTKSKSKSKKVSLEDVYPLSPIQQGMVFHSLSEPESGVYVVQNCWAINGDLDRAAFARVWQRVIENHPVLRTAFVWKRGDEPVQVVHTRVSLPLEELDWTPFGPEEQERLLEQYLEADRRKGFDLGKAPLMRIALIDVGPGQYEFVWSFHHLLLDGWSTSRILNELFATYEAFSKGQEMRMPPSRPYGDYIGWLRRQDLAKAEQYWRETLKGITSPTPLGMGKAEPTVANTQPFGADRENGLLSPETVDGLKSLAREHRLTLNTLVQGAWAILLSRYSGERDVVFGSVVSGRPPSLEGSESMVGLFINTLPVRVVVDGKDRVLDYLSELQRQQVELREYEYSPLVQVQGWSGISTGTLFESLVVFENYPTEERFQAKGASRVPLSVTAGSVVEKTNYPLELLVRQGLKLELMYDTRRFEPDSISLMSRHLKGILQAILSQPNQRLQEVTLLEVGNLGADIVTDSNPEVGLVSSTSATGDEEEAGEELAGPRDQYELQLLNIWEEILGLDQIGIRDSFFDLKGHSILALRMAGRAYKQFGVEVPLSAIVRGPTIEEIARIIRENANPQTGPLVAIQPLGKRRPFYCVHPIGGQVMCYLALARAMGSDQPFYGLEASGLDAAAARKETIEQMAKQYVECIRAAQPVGPYLLGGWSMGGVIAFEMAQQLRRSGQDVGLVAMLDTVSPTMMKGLAGYEDDSGFLMSLYARSQQVAKGQSAELRPEIFNGMTDSERLSYLKSAGIVPEEVEDAFAMRFLEGYKSRQKALLSYVPDSYEGRMVLIRAAREDESWLMQEYKRAGVDIADDSLGWKDSVQGELLLERVDSEHELMCSEPYVQEVAALLNNAIDKAARNFTAAAPH
jgi:thioesterase domain-containing protein